MIGARLPGAISGGAAWAGEAGSLGEAAADRRLALYSTLLFLLSFTKFRGRDSSHALQVSIDGQILFELFCYGVLALVAVYLYRRVRLANPRLRVSWLAVSFFAYSALAFASALWSPDVPMTIVRAGQLAITVLIPWLFSYLMTIKDFVQAMGRAVVLYCGVFAGLALTFPWADGTVVVPSGESRLSWFALHPGVAGGTAALAVLFCLFELATLQGRKHRRAQALLWVSLLVAMSSLLIATYTRGSLVALAMAIFILLFFGIPSRTGRIYVALLTVALFVLLASDIAHLSGRIEQYQDVPVVAYVLRGQDTEQFLSLTGRTALWSEVLKVIAADPWVGVGFGASRYSLIQHFSWAAEAHNAYLEAALQLGVVGALLLFVPVVVVFVRGVARLIVQRRASRDYDVNALVCAILGFSLASGVVSEGFSLVGYSLDTLIVSALVLFFPRSRSDRLPP